MSCPICFHTMHNLGVQDQRIFWCPRCGTIKTEQANAPDNVSIPFLVCLVRRGEDLSIRTSLDGCSIQYAVPASCWQAICEATGIKEPRGEAP